MINTVSDMELHERDSGVLLISSEELSGVVLRHLCERRSYVKQ